MSRLFLFGVFLFAIHVMSEMISRVMDKWCFETGQLSTYIITISKDTLDRFFKGHRDIAQIIKGLWDTFVKIQSILGIW